jgi:hypothetical protein
MEVWDPRAAGGMGEDASPEPSTTCCICAALLVLALCAALWLVIGLGLVALGIVR